MCDGEKWHSNTFKTVVRGGRKGAQPPRYGAPAVARCLAGEFPRQSVLYTQSLGAVGVACFMRCGGRGLLQLHTALL